MRRFQAPAIFPVIALAIAPVLALGLALLVALAGNAIAVGPPDADEELASVKAKLEARDYAGALAELRPLAASNPTPDVLNLMGFGLRKSGNLADAAIYYERALALDPSHKGALEYQGELFIQTGRIDMARANLARLQKLCPSGCEELMDLERALAAAAPPRR